MKKLFSTLLFVTTIANAETVSMFGQQVEVDMSKATPQERMMLDVLQQSEQQLKDQLGAITGNPNSYNELMEAGRQSKQQQLESYRQELNSPEFKKTLKELRSYCDNLSLALSDMRNDFEEAKRKDKARGQTYDIQDGYAYYISELAADNSTKSKARYAFIEQYAQNKNILEYYLYNINEVKKSCHQGLTSISTKPELWLNERAKVQAFLEQLGIYSLM